MKIRKKMMIVFSALALATTAANSISFIYVEVKALNEKTYSTLNTVGSKMVNEIEQYIQLMDFALDAMMSNSDFLNAFNEVYAMGIDYNDIKQFLSAQNVLNNFLFRVPIFENFYRVNIYTRDGFFLSNRFEKTEIVNSLSDEAREIVDTIEWLDEVDAHAFQRHIITPHTDMWTTTRKVEVFSAVRAVVWKGRHIGYFEVQSFESDLEKIFNAVDLEGVSVQAVLGNGNILYRAENDEADYSDLNTDGLVEYEVHDGNRVLVIPIYSKWKDLTVYIAQDISIFNQSMRSLIIRSVFISLMILGVTMLCIVIISFRLTDSIRKLTIKVKALPVEPPSGNFNDTAQYKHVISRKDREVYELETVFDEMVAQLKLSVQKELAMVEHNYRSEMNALQAQITPHFIYNTLNIISAKAMECGNDEIIKICSQFSQMLRYSTDIRSKTALLRDEISHVRLYLLLAKARYEDRLTFNINIPSFMEEIILPKLTLQPLVENTLKHGYKNSIHPMHINVEGSKLEDRLTLVVHDNGDGFPIEVLENFRESIRRITTQDNYEEEENDYCVGLLNTIARLNYYSKGAMRMKLYNNNGAVVEISMPYKN